jgi:hypothetical protein
MSDAGEVFLVQVYGTGDHAAAYRVRNMLIAAGIQAEVMPAHQYVAAPGGMSLFVEAPWYVIVPETDGRRARDLAERWHARFAEP